MPRLEPVDGDPFASGPTSDDYARLGRVVNSLRGAIPSPTPTPESISGALSQTLLHDRTPTSMEEGVAGVHEQLKNPVNAAELAMGIMGGPRLTPMRAAVPVAGIRAYHGSPYDFEKFDMSKIGTGEGAQAYGHGLYFAENPEVATGYKTSLSDRHPMHYEGQPVGPETPYGVRNALDWLKGTWKPGQTAEEVIARRINDLREHGDFMRNSNNPADRSAASMYDNAVRSLQELDPAKLTKNQGRMYEVNLNARPEQFLDWDRPLSQQPQTVQRALEPFGFKADKEGLRQFDDALLAALQDKGPTTLPRQPRDPAGEQIYSDLVNQSGMTASRARAAQADRSAMLREAGIPGIRYLDQGSRPGTGATQMLAIHGTPENAIAAAEKAKMDGTIGTPTYWDSVIKQLKDGQTHNYVVFDPSIIDILRKYGLAGLSALPPATAAFLSDKIKPVDHDPFAK